jgi:hypothetical protein
LKCIASLLIRMLFGKWVTSAHISRASSRLSHCTCAVTSSINEEATDAILWNSFYVYVCSCALNISKIIEGVAYCEITPVICFLNARNVLPSATKYMRIGLKLYCLNLQKIWNLLSSAKCRYFRENFYLRLLGGSVLGAGIPHFLVAAVGELYLTSKLWLTKLEKFYS